MKHADKFAMAAALALLGSYGAWAAVHDDAVPPPPDPHDGPAPYADEANRYAERAGLVDVEADWTSLHVAAPMPGDPRLPDIDDSDDDDGDGDDEPEPPTAGPASIDSIDATLDGVTLTASAAADRTIELQRRRDGGEWEPATAADTDVAFDATYEYRARARLGDLAGDWSEPVAATVPPQFRWELLHRFTALDGATKIQVRIFRYERPLGREVAVTLWQTPGERIGTELVFNDKRLEWEFDPMHQADGTRAEFNFDTGATLKSIEAVVETRRRRACTVVGGSCLGCTPRETVYSGKRIAIERPGGAVEESWFPPKAPYEDDVCAKHAQEE